MIAVNVSGLLREASGATRDIRLRDHYVSLGPDLELAGPVNGAIRLHRTNRGLLAHGRVLAPLRRTCARCLEPYVEEVTVEFREEFLPLPDAAPPTADEGAPEALWIDEHNEIDLAPPIHDELSLSEPMHPLCRPDCPGLCPVCGERLTLGRPHEHRDEEVDPRLASLARLLDRGED